jgi:hypothetical protein
VFKKKKKKNLHEYLSICKEEKLQIEIQKSVAQSYIPKQFIFSRNCQGEELQEPYYRHMG